MNHGEPKNAQLRASYEEESGLKKERETEDDGRYIIFYTFEDEEAGEGGESKEP
jgi:hypothetical protein